MKNIVIILTSGRSGSSLLVKLLDIFDYKPGINFKISRLIASIKKSNEKGHFENIDALGTNEYILNKFNSPWFSIYKNFTKGDQKIIHDNVHKAVMKISEEKGNNIVIKDPRMIYLIDYWCKYFLKYKVEIRYIYLYRKPQEYINSIIRRDKLKKFEAEGLWLSDNYQILKFLKNKNFLSLGFEELQNINNNLLGHISKFLNRKINYNKQLEFNRFYDPKLIRSRDKVNIESNEIIDLYNNILKIPTQARGHKINLSTKINSRIDYLALKQNKSLLFKLKKMIYFFKSLVRPFYTNHKFKL